MKPGPAGPAAAPLSSVTAVAALAWGRSCAFPLLSASQSYSVTWRLARRRRPSLQMLPAAGSPQAAFLAAVLSQQAGLSYLQAEKDAIREQLLALLQARRRVGREREGGGSRRVCAVARGGGGTAGAGCSDWHPRLSRRVAERAGPASRPLLPSLPLRLRFLPVPLPARVLLHLCLSCVQSTLPHALFSGRAQEYPSMNVNAGPFTHNDGAEAQLLRAEGTLPMIYRGVKYNVPVVMWLPERYPRAPPLCFVTPTPDMVLQQRCACSHSAFASPSTPTSPTRIA